MDMESSSLPFYQQNNMYHTRPTLNQYTYPSSEGYSSPASSIDSGGLSPPYVGYGTSQEAYGTVSIPCSHPMDLKMQPDIPSEKKTKRVKGKLPYSQRQSASEREKMRMRHLSKALQNLRRYIPPSVAPIGKSLTKIETLQLTIRYISLLSEQLGLSEEVLEQRRQASMQRTRYDQRSSCYLDMSQSLCSDSVKESMAVPSQKTPSIDPRWQNMQTSSEMPYELPQYSTLPVSPLENPYPATNTALPEPTDYYVASHQQMVSCEEYSHLVKMWRTEPSQV